MIDDYWLRVVQHCTKIHSRSLWNWSWPTALQIGQIHFRFERTWARKAAVATVSPCINKDGKILWGLSTIHRSKFFITALEHKWVCIDECPLLPKIISRPQILGRIFCRLSTVIPSISGFLGLRSPSLWGKRFQVVTTNKAICAKCVRSKVSKSSRHDIRSPEGTFFLATLWSFGLHRFKSAGYEDCTHIRDKL